jgi:hypothetical protein
MARRKVPPPPTAIPTPPADDPLRRGQRDSDLDTREAAEKRRKALEKIRGTPKPTCPDEESR